MSAPQLIEMPDTCAASVIISLNRIIGETQSPFTFESQAFKWPGEQWGISLNLPNITKRDIAAEWIAFGAAMEGKYNRFLLGDPMGKVPRGVATGTPLVNGGGQSGNTLVTDGWTASTNNIMRKGDYIQLGTGLSAKLHMLISDASSDSSGVANLNIVPALRQSPADNASIIVNNARGLFKLTQNTFSWSVNPGPIYRLSFEAVEAVGA